MLSPGKVMLLGALLLAFGARAMAQGPSGPPQPGPEHKKLAYFVGKWNSEGEEKASPFGPGGKFTGTETCEWFTGNFSVVCHSEGKAPEGSFKAVSIFSYDPAERTYVFFETNNYGENIYSRGTVEGDTWTWNNEFKMGGKPARARYTMKQVSGDVATYKLEMGSGDGPMAVAMEGKQTRAK